MRIALIAAMDKNRVIGKDNGLPWYLPEELKYFKKMTLGKPVIMGRKTFESMEKKPLPERQNIILTSVKDYEATGCKVVSSVEDALAAAGPCEELMVIGGAKVYEEFLPFADRLYLTIIHHEYSGDTYFPEINPKEWNLIAKQEMEGYTTQILDKKL